MAKCSKEEEEKVDTDFNFSLIEQYTLLMTNVELLPIKVNTEKTYASYFQSLCNLLIVLRQKFS